MLSLPRHHQPCAGDDDPKGAALHRIGMAGTSPAMTARTHPAAPSHLDLSTQGGGKHAPHPAFMLLNKHETRYVTLLPNCPLESSMAYLPAENRYDEMIYNRCGRSGLLLPAISLGLWHNFGEDKSA